VNDLIDSKFTAGCGAACHAIRTPFLGLLHLRRSPIAVNMRVSFDLDNTIVCGPEAPRELEVPWWLAWYCGKPVRLGASRLMRALTV
jgi:hypothetical protein